MRNCSIWVEKYTRYGAPYHHSWLADCTVWGWQYVGLSKVYFVSRPEIVPLGPYTTSAPDGSLTAILKRLPVVDIDVMQLMVSRQSLGSYAPNEDTNTPEKITASRISTRTPANSQSSRARIEARGNRGISQSLCRRGRTREGGKQGTSGHRGESDQRSDR